jgi:hypothetical protein
MTNTTKRILAWILFGIGILILAFFRNYTGNVIPYPWLIYVSGILCFLIGFFLLRKTPTIDQNKIMEKAKAFINDLKTNGEKLKVDLENCEIKENHYYEEQDHFKNASDIELLTAKDLIYLYNKLNYTPSDNQTYQSVVIFKTNYKGKDRTFYSPTIPKDKNNLLFKFGEQKTTTIYIDTNDSDKYYFDISFVHI